MTPPRPLLGLTLHRPWHILIARGIKKIENRRWWPGERLRPGEWFAIHAGKTYDTTCSTMAMERGVFPALLGDPLTEVKSAIVAVARYGGVVTTSADPWFFGPYGWQLDAVVPLAPITCKGAQGLWQVPAEIAEQCRAAYRAHQLSMLAAGQPA